jgi:hypothetical protein
MITSADGAMTGLPDAPHGPNPESQTTSRSSCACRESFSLDNNGESDSPAARSGLVFNSRMAGQAFLCTPLDFECPWSGWIDDRNAIVARGARRRTLTLP